MPIPKKQTSAIPKTARERIYQTLKEWIQQNTLKPGEQIYDKELAAYFEVSRTPVREAIQLLADQKLIEIRPGKESIVAPIDLDQIREIYVILGDLQALAIRFAFPNVTDQTIQQLESINGQISSASNEDFLELDHAFHQCILDAAGNAFLQNFYSILSAHIIRFQRSYMEMFSTFEREESVRSHQQIIDAIKTGELGLAEQSMNENFLYMLEKINDFDNQSL